MSDPEYTYWTTQPWHVVLSTKCDPLVTDVLSFTSGMAIERSQITQSLLGPTLTKIEDWATGCTWDSDGLSLQGITPDGSQAFVIVRNGTSLTCTCKDLAAQQRRRLGVFLGSLCGGLAGLAIGFATGVPEVGAVIGGVAAFTAALVTAGSTSPGDRIGITWVANEGESGGPRVPHPSSGSTEESGRRAKNPALRTAEA